MISPTKDGNRFELYDPVQLPKASAFLWNKSMMIHMNCRGYAVAQFMQPEPAKYAHAPNLEAKTFMQPEQPYYAHHPGRFFYIKDEETNDLFSAPYEPVRAKLDSFTFSAGKGDIQWIIEKDDIKLEITLSLPVDDPVELWQVRVINKSTKSRRISLYPYFPVGYMSWMNQSGHYSKDLCGIVCSSVTPYQKYQEYDKIKTLKDKTFLLADETPDFWEVNQSQFEGEGGLHAPSAIKQETLANGDAVYETPACVMQYRLALEVNESKDYKFLFGPALTENEVNQIRQKYLGGHSKEQNSFESIQKKYQIYLNEGTGCIHIKTPDSMLDNMVNHWLPRQMYYHGETNRLSTDPQTRNYLQDNMGMTYIQSKITRQAFITALSQQEKSGAMPDGILIQEDAELKYINQVPHTDHCVWLPICLKAYLDETNDYDFLTELLPFNDGDDRASVAEHIQRAMLWLVDNRDERGLNYINQGDWCDPMNMVGYKGRGVSGWLSMATSYALQVWIAICEQHNENQDLTPLRYAFKNINDAINKYLWDGEWYGRGITDDNTVFGVSKDQEGKVFLNPQSWALLSGCADEKQQQKMISSIEKWLTSPYGVEMLAPSFTSMREDIGRVTQKHPGSAENGSVYNHAAAFYVYSLYKVGENDKAFDVLRKMMPDTDMEDIKQRGQLPVFIPNYYRGASKQFPRTAGRSSQLFNTGTVHWMYRSLIDGLFGLKGTREGLLIEPKLPSHWKEVGIQRHFRGAKFNCHIAVRDVEHQRVIVNGSPINHNVITDIKLGEEYDVVIHVPIQKR